MDLSKNITNNTSFHNNFNQFNKKINKYADCIVNVKTKLKNNE